VISWRILSSRIVSSTRSSTYYKTNPKPMMLALHVILSICVIPSLAESCFELQTRNENN